MENEIPLALFLIPKKFKKKIKRNINKKIKIIKFVS